MNMNKAMNMDTHHADASHPLRAITSSRLFRWVAGHSLMAVDSALRPALLLPSRDITCDTVRHSVGWCEAYREKEE